MKRYYDAAMVRLAIDGHEMVVPPPPRRRGNARWRRYKARHGILTRAFFDACAQGTVVMMDLASVPFGEGLRPDTLYRMSPALEQRLFDMEVSDPR